MNCIIGKECYIVRWVDRINISGSEICGGEKHHPHDDIEAWVHIALSYFKFGGGFYKKHQFIIKRINAKNLS